MKSPDPSPERAVRSVADATTASFEAKKAKLVTPPSHARPHQSPAGGQPKASPFSAHGHAPTTMTPVLNHRESSETKQHRVQRSVRRHRGEKDGATLLDGGIASATDVDLSAIEAHESVHNIELQRESFGATAQRSARRAPRSSARGDRFKQTAARLSDSLARVGSSLTNFSRSGSTPNGAKKLSFDAQDKSSDAGSK